MPFDVYLALWLEVNGYEQLIFPFEKQTRGRNANDSSGRWVLVK